MTADEIARVYDFHTDSFAESLTYFPEQQDYTTGPEEYLKTIARAKKAVDIPVIASLNGIEQRGLDSLCEDDAGRRRRRPGIERLLRGRRRRVDRPGR